MTREMLIEELTNADFTLDDNGDYKREWYLYDTRHIIMVDMSFYDTIDFSYRDYNKQELDYIANDYGITENEWQKAIEWLIDKVDILDKEVKIAEHLKSAFADIDDEESLDIMENLMKRRKEYVSGFNLYAESWGREE